MTAPAAAHSSDDCVYGTPVDVCAAARELLGGIDLDPASCAEFNKNVQAAAFYTEKDNGLLLPWHGRVFLNPPGGWCDEVGRRVIKKRVDPKTKLEIGPCRETGECGLPIGHEHGACLSATKEWWKRLARDWDNKKIDAAFFVGFNQGILQTSQLDRGDNSICLDFPCCWPEARLPFLRLDGTPAKSPPQTSVLVYLPPPGLSPVEAVRKMRHAFREIGAVR